MAHPEQLGKYSITGVLGQGAMGIVYQGFDPDIKRDVALKTLRSGADASAGAGDGVSHGDRFRNEAQAAGRLQHPGIVAVYEYGHELAHDGGIDFIAMELVRGNTLSRYLTQAVAGQLTIGDDDVLSIVGQLLDALHHAHGQGVWHRDIKPSNLIMTRAGKIKVSDFGIARIASETLTRAASLVGTPLYMAPEQFRGLPIDHRVDLYATGVVLYQLLTGHPPFTGSPETLMYRAVHDTPPPPSSLPGLAHLAAFDGVLATALAKAPQDRFADALAFRDALAAVIGRRHNEAVSDATVTALLPARPAGGERGTTSGHPPTHFDPAVLAQAEASLARHVGPLAKVLVRQAARASADLPALLARLAEQVSDPAARRAFSSQVALLAPTASLPAAVAHAQAPIASPPAPMSSRPAPPPPTVAAPPASAALQAAAQQLLAQHLGPIAQVVVRRAAAAGLARAAFLQRVAESVADPKLRQTLLDQLSRMPD